MHRREDELVEDAVIAAIAQVHELVVVTRNVRDFKGLGVRGLDPFGFMSL
jgi:toxin FitB